MMTVEDATTRLRTLLLLLAATLLATLAEGSPPPLPPPDGRLHLHHNLNSVLDLASRIDRTLAAVSTTTTTTTVDSGLLLQVVESFSKCFSVCVWLQETFVEDVSHLAEGRDKCEVRRT